MNGIEKISARILADAETEAAAIRAQAEEKAAQLRADYDRKIESEQQRLTAEAQAEADKQLERDQGAARMAARRQLLETKQALVDAAFRQAEQQLLSLPTAEYTKLCAQLAARASASGSEELIFCTEDRERVGQAVVEQANALLQKAGKAAKLTLSAETRRICLFRRICAQRSRSCSTRRRPGGCSAPPCRRRRGFWRAAAMPMCWLSGLTRR